jgi:hypothetical protein
LRRWAWPGAIDALRERELRLLFIGQSVSVRRRDGRRGARVAVLEIGGSATQLGLVLAAGAVPFLAFLPRDSVSASR